MNRVIITGGAGFIGSNIANSYLDEGNYEVHVFDNFSTGKRENLQKNSNLFIHEIDLKKEIKQWPEINANIIFHLSANADVRGGEYNKKIDFEENVFVTKNVCDYASEHNIKKVVFSSSATIYGEPKVFPTPEIYSSSQTSVYGASKLCGEAYLEAYAEYGYFNATIFRFVSWTGKGYSHGVIYDFVKKLLKNKNKLEILGDGSQTKSYLDVRDGIKGVIELSKQNKNKSEVFNLGHHETMNVIELAKIVCDEMSLSNVYFEFTGGERGWVGDSPFVHLDTSKANDYGWHPKISIEDSIRSTVKYLLEDESRLFR